MMIHNITLAELRDPVEKVLVANGAIAEAARLVADTLVRSEAEGNTACGLHYVSVLCE